MNIKIIESPRDAMQGIKRWIPTKNKIKYVNQLLRVGFHTIDIGSFVSEKAIPQMKDTDLVLESLDVHSSSSQLSVIVANERGIDSALAYDSVNYLGFPFSISKIFQLKNTNKSQSDALKLAEILVSKCAQEGKQAIVYISMCFGNPYGEKWSISELNYWLKQLVDRGVNYFSLSDTIGCASAHQIQKVFSTVNKKFSEDFGAHFHSSPNSSIEKIQAAFMSKCYRFDGALMGLGGCPMAKDDLVGNLATEQLISFFQAKEEDIGLNLSELQKAQKLCQELILA